MKIRPLDLIEFDEPIPASAVYAPLLPVNVFMAMLGMMCAADRARKTRGRVKISIPEGMRVRIRCA